MLVLLRLGVSFLDVYSDSMVRRKTSGFEDLSGGMVIVTRLMGFTPEMGIVEGAAELESSTH